MSQKTQSQTLHLSQPVRSMTSFARVQNKGDFGAFSIEIRTVNQRFLDISLRLPEVVRSLEGDIREKLRDALARGKVELSVRFEPGLTTTDIQINTALTKQLIAASETIRDFATDAQLSLTDIMQWPGVLQTPDVDMDIIKPAFFETLDQALDALNEARAREGEALANLIQARLTQIRDHVERIRPHVATLMDAQREKLCQRIQDAKIEVDNNRLEQELVMWAQKADVTEELDRLDTHVDEVARTLQKGGPMGRRLDFLMQELNREANTLSSKAVSLVTTHAAVETKVLIEQMREQVQNIE